MSEALDWSDTDYYDWLLSLDEDSIIGSNHMCPIEAWRLSLCDPVTVTGSVSISHVSNSIRNTPRWVGPFVSQIDEFRYSKTEFGEYTPVTVRQCIEVMKGIII